MAVAPMRELAVHAIYGAVESQHDDGFGFRVDDPVLGNACLGVLLAFRFQFPLPILFIVADDFHHKVGTLRLMVRIGNTARLEKGNVRIAVLAGPQADGQRCEEYLAGMHGRGAGFQQEKEVAYDPLMKRTRHGEHLDLAVRKFHEPPGPLLQCQILAFRPLPLQGKEQCDGPRRSARLGGRR